MRHLVPRRRVMWAGWSVVEDRQVELAQADRVGEDVDFGDLPCWTVKPMIVNGCPPRATLCGGRPGRWAAIAGLYRSDSPPGNSPSSGRHSSTTEQADLAAGAAAA